ncbi:dEAD/DEAH box helicase domain protein [Coprobacillus sp. CAG:698]|nr:dEAD/DEAH box helicase domain protein [Coprobacillus sp. CAG:698]
MEFKDLQINEQILNGIARKEFTTLTEIQEKVIPFALSGKDLLGQAPTGTGKTLAFTIPILDKIDEEKRVCQALIIAPTRELAMQITSDINEISYYMNVKAVTLYGGELIDKQITALRRKPQVIVATPGRLLDHVNRGTVSLDNVKIVVLDEADEMLDMGFREDINAILDKVPEHQTMLFSATFSNDIEEIAYKYMNDPKKIAVNHGSLTVERIDQKYILCAEKDKIEVISRIIEVREFKIVMIFCNTKKSVDEVTSALLTRGFLAEALHGDMKQMQRDRVMARFREGTINVLVASDVAARGLDIENVDVVFNYDLPTDEEYYVHRIGRTGRASKDGLSISLITPKEKWRLYSIIRYAKTKIEQIQVPSLDKVIKLRTKRLLSRALEIASLNNNFEDVDYESNKYMSIIEKQIEKFEDAPKDLLIKGLLSIIINADGKNNEIEEAKEEVNSRLAKNSQGGVRMFITLGKRDNIRIYTITDMLVKNTSLSNAEINNVSLCDNFSFFEVPSEHVEEVLSLSDEIRYKGRRLRIEVTKNPKIKPEKERSRKRKDIFEQNYIVNGRDAVNRKTRSKEKEKRSKKRK